LKGFAIGGAWVSEKHANFIITDKNARAADVEAVMDHVKKEVEKQFTIELVPEVHVVGEAA
ncbi:MAG: UDP-N-acetylmuramate dehydrogenase, partial [bacterium]